VPAAAVEHPHHERARPRLLGDRVRTAISTRINTASDLDLATLFAASAWTPKLTKPFTFHTDAGVAPYAIDRFLSSAKTAMSRRQVEMDAATEARFRTLCETRALNNPADTPPKLRCAAHRRAWAGYSEAPNVFNHAFNAKRIS